MRGPSGLESFRPVAPLFSPGDCHKLEGPERDLWQHPTRIVEALEIQPGQTVADIGSGTGYLIPHLSRAVGSRGRVIAEEIQREFLSPLESRARALGNVSVVLGTPDDPRLPRSAVDHIVLLTVYHEVAARERFLAALRRAARPGAQLAIIDFPPSDAPGHPSPPPHQLAEEHVLREASAAGWKLDRRETFLAFQYFLIFRAG